MISDHRTFRPHLKSDSAAVCDLIREASKSFNGLRTSAEQKDEQRVLGMLNELTELTQGIQMLLIRTYALNREIGHIADPEIAKKSEERARNLIKQLEG